MNKMCRGSRLGTISTLCGVVVLLCCCISSARSSTALGLAKTGLTPLYNLSSETTNEVTVCKSMDIRNSVESFRGLENCTVVEGFVQILLFDNVNESEFKDISFPRLTEITDFLLLYRVNGLRSVGQLFPNLAVIRGQTKMFDYSLVIYEMSNLQDIGLYSLREISSGFVRVDKNPSLCFLNTINWQVIARDHGDHFLKNVRSEDECALCPGEDNYSNLTCPQNPSLCWNREHCQVICPETCKNNCDSKGNCCDKKCIGCKDNQPDKCLVCRHVAAGKDCRTNCTKGYYKYLNRRCITEEECIQMPRPIILGVKPKNDKPYKILNGECVLECPPDHTEDKNNRCVKCSAGRCQKRCPGVAIDSLTAARELRGCTQINGSLEIHIRGGKNVVNELEENLSMIEEIDGYLKVVRSFPLISLNFLKKLKVIRGNVLESNKYVFYVLDNQNLEYLWDWEDRTIKILRGKLFFHFNPRLCLNKIRELQNKTGLEEFTNLEVASNSNGDKIACNIKKLKVNVTRTHSKSIVLSWDAFEMNDHRKLLGYVVYVIAAPFRNVTLFDGRDACGGDGWRVDDVPIETHKQTYLLTQLQPYTQYAFYVKTYTIASEDTGAQSDIQYVRTTSGKPSLPMDFTSSSVNHKVHLQWKPPQSPNGKIIYYFLNGDAIELSREESSLMRDFCTTKQKAVITRYHSAPTVRENETCVCTNPFGVTPRKGIPNASSAEDQITFEDRLYDFVYIKRDEAPDHLHSERTKRSIDNNLVIEGGMNYTAPRAVDEKEKRSAFNITVNGTEYLLEELKHFMAYNFYVKACCESEEGGVLCSDSAKVSFKTERRDDVDVVTSVRIQNITYDSAVITWNGPEDPNGFVESYHITYGLVDDIDSHNQTRCISVNSITFRQSYVLRPLKPGNWSLQMAVTTQAGTGKMTKVYYFTVETPPNYAYYIIAVLFLILAIVGIFVYKIGYKCTRNDNMKLITSINPEYVSTTYVPDEWEVQRDKIKLLKELGQGSFGMVYEGIATDIRGRGQIRCALKTVNEHATDRYVLITVFSCKSGSICSERVEFLNEASVMKQFDTTHVVRLLGVVSQGQPTLVIMELMANGDLKSYLRSHRPDTEGFDNIERKPPTLKQILQMATEICDGMSYLEAKKFVHRDVAARNCMVSDNLVVKIGDFGMTRDIYETDYYRKGSKGLLPVRWMAPESLKDGVFTSSSDVWSYGVVLWEMATLASQPYQGLANDQVLRYVIGGNIMERPEKCPDILYDLMKRCWQYKPNERPMFIRLCEDLLPYVRPGFEEMSFFHSPAGVEARNQRTYRSASLDDATVPLRTAENYSDESEHGDDGATNLKFINYPSMTNHSSTANGYVSNRPSTNA